MEKNDRQTASVQLSGNIGGGGEKEEEEEEVGGVVGGVGVGGDEVGVGGEREEYFDTRDRHQSIVKHAKLQEKMLYDEKKNLYCMIGRYLAVVITIFTLLGYNLAFYLDQDRNSFTATTYEHFESIDMPYFIIANVHATMDCTVVGITYDAVLQNVESVNRIYPDNYTFVYDESVTEWILLKTFQINVLNISLGATLLIPPYGRQIPKDSYFGLINVCEAVNETMIPEDNGDSSAQYHIATWSEFMQLKLEHFYTLWISIGSAKDIEENGATEVVYADHAWDLTPAAGISVYTIGVTENRDYINDVFETVFDTTADGGAQAAKYAFYDNQQSIWYFRSELWFVPNSDSLKLVVSKRRLKSLFDVFATIGGFMSPLQNALVLLSSFLLSGIVLKAVNVEWQGLAPYMPLNPVLRRQVDLFLASKQVVTKEKFQQDMLAKDQEISELKKELLQMKEKLDRLSGAT